MVKLTRKQILSVSLDVFASKGYNNTTLEDIAAESQTDLENITRYFSTKTEIFAANVDQLIADVTTRVLMNENPAEATNLDEYRRQMGRIADSLFRIFIEHRKLGRLVLYESMQIDKELMDKMNFSAELLARFTEHYLYNGVEKGFLRKNLNIEITAKLINGMILISVREAMTLSHLSEAELHMTGEEWIQVILELMTNGIRKG